MQPDLTDYELETAARACRALAHRERESAATISDPSLRGPVQERARCAAALVEKFEAARRALSARLGSSPSPDRTPLACDIGIENLLQVNVYRVLGRRRNGKRGRYTEQNDCRRYLSEGPLDHEKDHRSEWHSDIHNSHVRR